MFGGTVLKKREFFGPFRDAQKLWVLTKSGAVLNCGKVLIRARREQEASDGRTKTIVEEFRACVGKVGCQIHPATSAHHKNGVLRLFIVFILEDNETAL